MRPQRSKRIRRGVIARDLTARVTRRQRRATGGRVGDRPFSPGAGYHRPVNVSQRLASLGFARLALTVVAAVGGAGCARSRPQRVEVVPAPVGNDVAALVRDALAAADRDGRDLVVYVGAPWCEPCQRFHEAAAAGKLDRRFPHLRLLEFDLDRDRDRLAAAGYASRMIPLFARPEPDGRSSALRIEGSIKGEGAVLQIAPRLEAILATRRSVP